MSRDLERRLAKMEAKHHAERGIGKRIERMTDAELTAAIEPYLPIVRTFVLLGNVVPNLRERLLQRIEAALGSED